MADANIKVDWNELERKGRSMVSEANHMEQILTSMKREVKSFQQTWQSNSSDTMIQHIDKFQSTINRYQKVVTDYGDFLKKASSTYSNTESTVASAANNLYFK